MANFLIISASSEIGQSAVKMLQDAGHQLFQTALDKNRIEPDVILDATDFTATEQVFQQAKEKMGEIHGVVNFAGSLLKKPAHLVSKEQYQDSIDASLTTAFSTVRAAGIHMENGGSVVLISAAVAMEGMPQQEAHAAAKAGVAGLTLSAAATYANRQLRFNAVAPGFIETPLTESVRSNESARKACEAAHPLGRMGKPEDVARAIVFLLDPANNWITGQILAVDGGLSCLHVKIK